MQKWVYTVLIGMLLLSGCGNSDTKTTVTEAANVQPSGLLAGWTIAVDAGHGGIDNGCVGVSGAAEAELNLAVAYALKDALEAEDARVIMTRTDGDVVYDDASADTHKAQDMAARLDVIEAEDADLVISIHMNKYSDARVRGAQTFYDGEDSLGRSLALALQEELNDLPEQVKKRSAMAGNYFILKTPDCPGALVECGFLSNPEEEALLQQPEYRSRLAAAISSGVFEYCRSGQK